MLPVAWVGGRSTVPPVPATSPMRYRDPAAIDPVRGVTNQFVVPVGAPEMYWTDQPSTATGAPDRLPSSMKSFLSVAPLLPPPP